MENQVKVYSVAESDRFELGTLKKMVTARFMVGQLGPFSVEVEKLGDWSTTLRAAIAEEVRRVEALQS